MQYNTVALKRLSGKSIPKTNQILPPKFDGCAGESGDKVSWLVEDWAITARPNLELMPHDQYFRVDQHPLQPAPQK